MAILVFDMGGSAVKYGVWAQDSLVSKGKFTTPNTWEEMKAQLQQVRASVDEEIEGVGISAPGAVNAQERRIDGISAIPYIHGFDIYSELEAAFGVPVTIENDANCAGMAEFYQGAGKEYQQAAFVVIGSEWIERRLPVKRSFNVQKMAMPLRSRKSINFTTI